MSQAKNFHLPDLGEGLPDATIVEWFVKEGDTYCVVKELREMCIFSQHSLIKDAPFSRLDLVSCRNLLIYLDAELQEKVIPLFHFALRPGGFLFLGNSENASRHQNLFVPVEPRSRIFRRLDTATRVFADFPFTSVDRPQIARSAGHGASMIQPTAARDLTRWAEHAMERHKRVRPQGWHSSSGCFPVCSRPAICTSAITSEPLPGL